MNLIKQLAADLAEAQEKEELDTPFIEAERTLRKIELGEAMCGGEREENLLPDAKEESARIASYWRGRAHSMSDSELRDAIANDLEQIEYSPDQVEKLVPRILRMVRK